MNLMCIHGWHCVEMLKFRLTSLEHRIWSWKLSWFNIWNGKILMCWHYEFHNDEWIFINWQHSFSGNNHKWPDKQKHATGLVSKSNKETKPLCMSMNVCIGCVVLSKMDFSIFNPCSHESSGYLNEKCLTENEILR